MEIKICKCCGKPKKPKGFAEIVGEVCGVVSSPPYAESIHDGNGIDRSKLTGNPAGPHSQAGAEGYGNTPGQIGTLKSGSVDAVVTSPPYVGGGHHADQTGAWNKNGRGQGMNQDDANYGKTAGQIGQLYPDEKESQSETYWQAMRQVYSQMFAALKPGGVSAIVVKAYVKNKQIVPLPDQTWELLMHLGFEPVERVRAMLVSHDKHPGLFGEEVVKTKKRASFFRRLAESKGSPPIDWEDVLWVRKPALIAEQY